MPCRLQLEVKESAVSWGATGWEKRVEPQRSLEGSEAGSLKCGGSQEKLMSPRRAVMTLPSRPVTLTVPWNRPKHSLSSSQTH